MSFASRLSSGRGQVVVTLSSNQLKYVFNPAACPGYQAGNTDAVLVINSGVYVWSDTTALSALSVAGFNAADRVTVKNAGYIMGCGGDGGNATPSVAYAGLAGGPAISIANSLSIDSTLGYIGGGGGGGGGSTTAYGGGGAGGGIDGSGSGGTAYATTATALGSYGTSGIGEAGASGGRALPGSAAGAGGSASPNYPSGTYQYSPGLAGSGGGGGGVRLNSYGSSGAGGGGGGWGMHGGAGYWVYPGGQYTTAYGGTGGVLTAGIDAALTAGYDGTIAGGAGGNAIILNGNSVTWVGGTASSSRAYGAIS